MMNNDTYNIYDAQQKKELAMKPRKGKVFPSALEERKRKRRIASLRSMID